MKWGSDHQHGKPRMGGLGENTSRQGDHVSWVSRLLVVGEGESQENMGGLRSGVMLKR